MKCPNYLCGPVNRPTLVDAGIGTLKFCNVCKKYYTSNGTLVLTRDIEDYNPGHISEDEEEEDLIYNPKHFSVPGF